MRSGGFLWGGLIRISQGSLGLNISGLNVTVWQQAQLTPMVPTAPPLGADSISFVVMRYGSISGSSSNKRSGVVGVTANAAVLGYTPTCYNQLGAPQVIATPSTLSVLIPVVNTCPDTASVPSSGTEETRFWTTAHLVGIIVGSCAFVIIAVVIVVGILVQRHRNKVMWENMQSRVQTMQGKPTNTNTTVTTTVL